MDYSDISSSDSEHELFDCDSLCCPLRFDPDKVEGLIKALFEKFDVRIFMNEKNISQAVLVTAGFTLAGKFIGNHYGGQLGAMIGSAVGGAAGAAFVLVAMKDIWNEVKNRLWQLYDIVYDYFTEIGVTNYAEAALVLTSNTYSCAELAQVCIAIAGQQLQNIIISNLND